MERKTPRSHVHTCWFTGHSRTHAGRKTCPVITGHRRTRAGRKTCPVQTGSEGPEPCTLTVVGGVRRCEAQGRLGALEARLAPVGDGLQLHSVVAAQLQRLQDHRVLRLQAEGRRDCVTSRPHPGPPARGPRSSGSPPAPTGPPPGLTSQDLLHR